MKSFKFKSYLLIIMLFLSGSSFATGGNNQEPPAQSESNATSANQPAEIGFWAWFYENFIK